MSDSSVFEPRDVSERRVERVMRGLFLACAIVTVLVTVGIIVSLVKDAMTFFAFPSIDVVDFLLGTEWKPTQLTGDGTYAFGVLPLLSGTIVITVVSGVLALPIGLAAAVYLSEYASERTRGILKPALEVLAGVPTVVYGYFALVYITPFLDGIGLPVGTFNALSAAIVVAVMTIPMISSISEDALHAVPTELRQASYGLGATKFDTVIKVVIPAAISGIFSSFILAISRAIGETMAVTIAAGRSPQLLSFTNLDENLFQSVETLTAAMVHVVGAENVSGQSPALYSLFALGLLLFVFTFSLNLVAEYMRGKFHEVYQ